MIRSVEFHRGFHLFCMLVALAAGVAGGIVIGEERSQDTPRLVDVTEQRVIASGCGQGRQRERLYIAMEEDDLPGPTCETVRNLTPVS